MSEAVKLRLLRNGASSGGSLAVRPDAVAALKAKAVAKLKLESVDSDAIRLFEMCRGLLFVTYATRHRAKAQGWWVGSNPRAAADPRAAAGAPLARKRSS